MTESATGDVEAVFTIAPTLNVKDTVRGAKLPVMVGPTELWWVTRTPDGPGTLNMERVAQDQVLARAWGPGAQWMANQTPRLLGDEDDLTGFDPQGPVRQAWRRKPFKLARTDILWDALIGAVFGQKVQVANAVKARRLLARRYGEAAPGPRSGWVLPSADRVAEMGYYEFHRFGVERKRADTLIRVAREFSRLEGLGQVSPEAAKKRLQRVRGIGPWTAAMATAVAYGDADAVPVGDFHIPNTVAWMLAKEPRADDERMLELLEPYRGHRWRVIRLAKSTGRAPAYGPKLSLTGDGLNMGS